MKTQPLILWAALLPTLSAALPSHAAPVPGSTVTIISTGDRLTPGYRATVAADGTLAGTLVSRRGKTAIHRTSKMIAPIRERFFADLQKAEPLDRLPTETSAATPAGRRGRRGQQATPTTASTAINPRPQIYVRYQGRQSPNLRIATTTEGRVFYQDVKQALRLPIPNLP